MTEASVTAATRGQRVIHAPNPNADQYIWELRGAYAGMRIWDPDFALSRDRDIYEKMLRDPTIRNCLKNRISTVAGGKWNVVPPEDATSEDEQAAKVCKLLLKEIRGFDAARSSLAKFIWEGRRHAVVEGGRQLRDFGSPGRSMEWWVPTNLRDMNKRRIRTWREGGRVIRKIERITDDKGISHERYEFPRDRIITEVYEDEESRLGFGRGLGDSCYWPFFGKWKLLEEGVRSSIKWAQGIPVVKVDEASIGDTTQTTENIRDAVANAVRDLVARGVLVIGKNDEVEWEHGESESNSLFLLLDKFDDMIREVLTGSKLPTGGGGEVGSLARAEVEQDTSEGLFQLDSRIFDESITVGLVHPVWDRNIENFRELGLEKARMPSFTSVDEPTEDHEVNSRIIVGALGAGMTLKGDEAFEKMGLTKPSEEDIAEGNVIEGQSAPMPGDDPFGADNNGRESDNNGQPDKADPETDFAIQAALHFARTPKRAREVTREVAGVVESAGPAIRVALVGLTDAVAHNALSGIPIAAKVTGQVEAAFLDLVTAADIQARLNVLEETGLAMPAPALDRIAQTVPKIPFGEAVEDIVRRHPEVRRTAEDVAAGYAGEGRVFALARSATRTITARAQDIVADHLERGALRELTVSRLTDLSEDFSRGYADMVLQTNATTAYTRGRFRQSRDPDFKAVIPAFRLSVVRDSAVRRGRRGDSGENHFAADGLIAAVDDPIWRFLAPPFGYGCRCRVIPVSRADLKRRNLLDDLGNVIRWEPPAFKQFQAHENFRAERTFL